MKSIVIFVGLFALSSLALAEGRFIPLLTRTFQSNSQSKVVQPSSSCSISRDQVRKSSAAGDGLGTQFSPVRYTHSVASAEEITQLAEEAELGQITVGPGFSRADHIAYISNHGIGMLRSIGPNGVIQNLSGAAKILIEFIDLNCR